MQILNKREFYEKIYGDDIDALIEQAIEAGDLEEGEIDFDSEARFVHLDSLQMADMGLNMSHLDRYKAVLLEVQELKPDVSITMEDVDLGRSYPYLEIFIDIDEDMPTFFTVPI